MIHFSRFTRRNPSASGIVILLLVFSLGAVVYSSRTKTRVEQVQTSTSNPVTDFHALHMQALTHYTDYRADDAIPLLEKVRDHHINHFGLNQPKTIIALSNLGAAYGRANRHSDAIALLEPIHANRANTVGPNDRNMLTLSYNLAIAYKNVGRYHDALQLIDQIIEIQRQTLGPDHSDTMKSEDARAWLEALDFQSTQ